MAIGITDITSIGVCVCACSKARCRCASCAAAGYGTFTSAIHFVHASAYVITRRARISRTSIIVRKLLCGTRTIASVACTLRASAVRADAERCRARLSNTTTSSIAWQRSAIPEAAGVVTITTCASASYSLIAAHSGNVSTTSPRNAVCTTIHFMRATDDVATTIVRVCDAAALRARQRVDV